MVEGTASDKLKAVGLRPTRQRLILAEQLWQVDSRHVTAEQLHNECKDKGAPVSMATVYNTLHQFVDAGLLKEVTIDNGSSYFDTNTEPHHHFYFEDIGYLEDIAAEKIQIPDIPLPQRHKGKIKSVEVIIRLHSDTQHAGVPTLNP